MAGNLQNDSFDVFISYSWGIKEDVEKFHEKLEANNFRVWRDKFLKQGHESLFGQLGKKIKESTVFLCFLTKDYVKSDNCRKELNYAVKLKKTIIYLMIEKMSSDDIGEEIGFIMGNSIYTQCYKNPTSWWLENFQEIKNSIAIEIKEIKPRNKLFEKWKVNDSDNFFHKISDSKWEEIQNGKTFATFDFVEQINDKVILFAADRDFYLTLDSNAVKWGPTREKADFNQINNGKWVNENCQEIENSNEKMLNEIKLEKGFYERWKVNGKAEYFRKLSDSKWEEIKNGKLYAKFDFVEQINDKVILFASDRNFYLTIDSNTVKWGPTREKANLNQIHNGKWINEN